MQKTKTRKGFANIAASALGIGVAIIVVAMMVTILGGLADTQTADTYEYNVTTQGQSGLAQYGNWWTILVLLSIFGIVLTVLGGRSLIKGGGL